MASSFTLSLRWLHTLTPVTYLCKLLEIPVLAVSTHHEDLAYKMRHLSVDDKHRKTALHHS